MDKKIEKIKKWMDIISAQGGKNDDTFNAAVVCLTLLEPVKGECNLDIGEEDMVKLACRVLDVQRKCAATQTYEERVLAILKLADIGSAEDVLTMSDEDLAKEIDHVGIGLLNDVVENYSEMAMYIED